MRFDGVFLVRDVDGVSAAGSSGFSVLGSASGSALFSVSSDALSVSASSDLSVFSVLSVLSVLSPSEVAEVDDFDGEESASSAQATPWPVKTADPTPSATASPPTRPTYVAAPIKPLQSSRVRPPSSRLFKRIGAGVASKESNRHSFYIVTVTLGIRGLPSRQSTLPPLPVEAEAVGAGTMCSRVTRRWQYPTQYCRAEPGQIAVVHYRARPSACGRRFPCRVVR